MDDEVDPTWLSGLIDQADKLILAIGGYEEASGEKILPNLIKIKIKTLQRGTRTTTVV